MNIAKTISAKAKNGNEAFKLAESRKHDVDQDYKNEATIYKFSDKSILVLSGPNWYAVTKTGSRQD